MHGSARIAALEVSCVGANCRHTESVSLQSRPRDLHALLADEDHEARIAGFAILGERRLGDFQLVKDGEPLNFNSEEVSYWLASSDEIKLMADLGVGPATATVWSCDLSYKYVEINAEYHT